MSLDNSLLAKWSVGSSGRNMYRKAPKFSDTRKLYSNLLYLKFKQSSQVLGYFVKSTIGIVDPDQTAPLGL